MKAEYFPPKEDVILQNEAPTDLYILVTGAVVRTTILPTPKNKINMCVLSGNVRDIFLSIAIIFTLKHMKEKMYLK
jgi:hypothetical protein